MSNDSTMTAWLVVMVQPKGDDVIWGVTLDQNTAEVEVARLNERWRPSCPWQLRSCPIVRDVSPL